MSPREQELGLFDRLFDAVLSAFGKVRPGEGLTAALMFLNIFIILSAYYVLKVARDALIVSGSTFGLGGDELKIYATSGMALLLFIIVPAYGLLASRVPRLRLINTTGAFVIAGLLSFFALARVGLDIALAFYLFIGIISVFLIAQFWSYANDIYSESQGKRLFAIIAVGGSVGAALGPFINSLARGYTYELFLVTSAAFGLALALYNLINRRVAQASSDDDKEEAEAPLKKQGGFRLVVSNRYLLLIALMILLANLVNTTGEFILANYAKEHAEEQVPAESVADIEDEEKREAELDERRGAVLGNFYGTFYGLVNIISLLVQAFVVSRIYRYLGVRFALFVLPAVAFLGYASIALIGGIVVIRIAKTAENSLDYSLQNTNKQALFLPTSREAKYKAKAAIDTFFVRIGDAVSGALTALGIHVLAFGRSEFAFVAAGFVLLWLLLTTFLAREHKKLMPDDRGRVPGAD